MRAIVQRVQRASVSVDGREVGRIGEGLLLYTAVATGDTPADAHRLAEKIAHLRIFPDEDGKMNLSVRDTGGGVLAISNFTVLGDTRKGRRPAFVAAARPEDAQGLHDLFVQALRGQDLRVETGVFQAHMHIDAVADGPVNVVVEVPAT